ncbi:hypothetical protein D5275_10860 [Adlercreutzia muris]|nr:hypothetical protein [Adlercreutzia muris]
MGWKNVSIPQCRLLLCHTQLVLLVMVVLEFLSSRGSLACPAAGGSRGGRRRHFLPLLDSM